MRVLVTGGAGFIGSHCVDRLLASGYEVVVFDLLPVEQASNVAHCLSGITYVQGDIRDWSALVRVMQGNIDAVIHLAAFVSVPASVTQPLESFSHNVTGTQQVFEAMKRVGVMRGVYASSAAVYGQPRKVPTPETEPLVPQSPYGLHKMMNEQQSLYYRSQHNLQLTGLRFFNVFGERQDSTSAYSGVISIFADRTRHDQPVTIYGDGESTRDYISVRNVADVCIGVIKKSESLQPVYNVGTGYGISLLNLVKVFSAISSKELAVEFAPARVGDITHSKSDISQLEYDGLRPQFKLFEDELRRLYLSLS